MEKIKIGATNIEVSRLGLGTVKFGRNSGVKYPESFDLPDDYTLTRLLSVAQEEGINFLDTAPAYGTSEERIGALLHERRKEWIISTKFGEEFDNEKSWFDFSPAHCVKSVERSLKRLRTDYIDILLIHSDGNDLKILGDDKLILTLRDLKKKGVVRAIGASTKTVEGGLKALEILDAAMVSYSAAHPDEAPVLDRAAELGKPALLKKVLNSGDLRKMSDADPVQAAFDFAFTHPGAGAAVVGTIKPERLRLNALAVSCALSSAASRESK